MIKEAVRIFLRPFEIHDAGVLADIWGNSRVMSQCGGPIDKGAIAGVIEKNINSFRNRGNAVFAVVEKCEGNIIGVTGCKLEEDARRGELIYHFRQSVWGQGFASEAVSAYLEWVKQNGIMDYICASVLPGNEASIKILIRNGFRQNGFVSYEDTGYIEEPFFELLAKDKSGVVKQTAR